MDGDWKVKTGHIGNQWFPEIMKNVYYGNRCKFWILNTSKIIALNHLRQQCKFLRKEIGMNSLMMAPELFTTISGACWVI